MKSGRCVFFWRNLSAPELSAGPSELSSLFALAGSYGVLTKHHLKDEGKNILPAVVSLIQLAREAGAKMHLSHFKILGRASWPLFRSWAKRFPSSPPRRDSSRRKPCSGFWR